MFIYVRQKNGKIARVTVPDWDIVNPLALQTPDIGSDSKSQTSSGIGGDGGAGGSGSTVEETPQIVLSAFARYLD